MFFRASHFVIRWRGCSTEPRCIERQGGRILVLHLQAERPDPGVRQKSSATARRRRRPLPAVLGGRTARRRCHSGMELQAEPEGDDEISRRGFAVAEVTAAPRERSPRSRARATRGDLVVEG